MKQHFDLHIHTSFSDGEDSVDKIVEKIKQEHINIFSITDHDSVESIYAIKDCDLDGLTYIKGIEVSSILDNYYKLHILGYFIDENDIELNNMIKYLKNARKQRFIELYEQIETLYNFKIPISEINYIAQTQNVPGKPHLAKLMIKYNYVNSVSEAFDLYLEKLETKTSNRYPADQVIKIIHAAGGVAIWAHPKKFEKKYDVDFKDLMPRLLDLGLDGVEPYNSSHSYDDSQRFLQYAKESNLLISGGSDYHGLNVKPNVKLGVIYNSFENIEIDNNSIDIIEKSKEVL